MGPGPRRSIRLRRLPDDPGTTKEYLRLLVAVLVLFALQASMGETDLAIVARGQSFAVRGEAKGFDLRTVQQSGRTEPRHGPFGQGITSKVHRRPGRGVRGGHKQRREEQELPHQRGPSAG